MAEHAESGAGDEDTEILGIRISHPDRVVFEGQGATKRAVAEYLAGMAPRMLDHLRDRPTSLVRCPSGAGGKCFYQKHHTGSVPDEIGETQIEEKDGDLASYLVFNSAEALVAAAQIGALEFHIWGARTDKLERPDRLVIDLDPDEGLGFAPVKDAAFEVRDLMAKAGLDSWPLLTGGKGIHVVAPLERRSTWETVKAAAKGLARQLTEKAPDTYIDDASKSLRKGRIFIDWMRNERGATAICPFSPRARPGAPVATPVSWVELPGIDAADAFTLSTIAQRLSGLNADPWEAYASTRQSIGADALGVLAGD